MTAWNPTDLAAIERAIELRVAADRPDGTRQTPRIVWHVVVDNFLFIRSVRGENGAWYRALQRIGTGVIDAGGVHSGVTFLWGQHPGRGDRRRLPREVRQRDTRAVHHQPHGDRHHPAH